MVILLCDQFWHCPKHSGFPALPRRGWGNTDGIVGPVGHETRQLKGIALADMNFIPLKLSVTNCFLVKVGDHYVLVDTGYEDDWQFVPHTTKQSWGRTVATQSYYSDASSRRSLRVVAQHFARE
jgi:hypothetical protein